MTNISIKSTLASGIDGIEAALDRAKAFFEAGADMIFFEALRSEAAMDMISKRLSVPRVTNIVAGGKTPLTPQGFWSGWDFLAFSMPTPHFRWPCGHNGCPNCIEIGWRCIKVHRPTGGFQ